MSEHSTAKKEITEIRGIFTVALSRGIVRAGGEGIAVIPTGGEPHQTRNRIATDIETKNFPIGEEKIGVKEDLGSF